MINKDTQVYSHEENTIYDTPLQLNLPSLNILKMTKHRKIATFTIRNIMIQLHNSNHEPLI